MGDACGNFCWSITIKRHCVHDTGLTACPLPTPSLQNESSVVPALPSPPPARPPNSPPPQNESFVNAVCQKLVPNVHKLKPSNLVTLAKALGELRWDDEVRGGDGAWWGGHTKGKTVCCLGK